MNERVEDHHVITQDASLLLGILPKQKTYPVTLVVPQIHVDGGWH